MQSKTNFVCSQYRFILPSFLMKRLRLFLISCLFLLLLDLVTKYIFVDLQWWDYFFFLAHVCNTGVSFSFPLPYWLMISIGTLATIVLVRAGYTRKLSMWCVVILLAGVLGNLFDRIVYDCVRDFLFFPRFVCNLADVYLSGGVVILIWQEFFGKKKWD